MNLSILLSSTAILYSKPHTVTQRVSATVNSKGECEKIVIRAWICRLTCLQELSYPLTRCYLHHRCYSRRREPNTTRSMERAYEPPVAGWRRPGQLRRARPRRPSLLPLLYSCALFLRNHHLWLLHHLLLVLILVYLGWQQLDLEKKPPLGRCRHP